MARHGRQRGQTGEKRQVFAALIEDTVEEIPIWFYRIWVWHYSGNTP
jgi:hypothetical protein